MSSFEFKKFYNMASSGGTLGRAHKYRSYDRGVESSLSQHRERENSKNCNFTFKKFNCMPMVAQLIELLLPVEDQVFKSRLC